MIDADALLKKFDRMWDCTDLFFEPKELLCDPLSDCKGCKWKEILDFVKRIVKSSKTVDAVPVVRCKDCKHAKQGSEFLIDENLYDCVLHEENHNPNYYCASGERKDC